MTLLFVRSKRLFVFQISIPLRWSILFSSFTIVFPLYPCHKELDYPALFVFRQGSALRHSVPLIKTAPTTAGAGVLSDKNGMSPHRSLLSVVRYNRRSKPFGNKIGGMGTDQIQSLFVNIFNVFFRQVKARTEFRPVQFCESFVNGLHGNPSLQIFGLLYHSNSTFSSIKDAVFFRYKRPIDNRFLYVIELKKLHEPR